MKGVDDVKSACESIVTTLLRDLLTDSVMFQLRYGVCTPVAGTANGAVQLRWRDHLMSLDSDGLMGVIAGPDGSVATFVDIGPLGDLRIFLVIDADVTQSKDVLAACASIIAFGLEAIRHREEVRTNRGLLRNGYRLVLAVSRARGSDGVAKAITAEMSRFLRADRLSVWKYQPENDQLVLAATHGFSMEGLPAVRPGDWVLGHVYQSGQAVVVNNTAELPALPAQRGRYASRAFAVVPLVHNRRSVGVWCVTDQRDRAPFTALQQFALRALAPFMGSVLAAADCGERIEDLRHTATVDSVTGLHNRTFLDGRLHEEVQRSHRDKRPLSVLMVDIDNFKPINDTHGHAAGDAVLKQVGHVIRSAVRIFDICARYGGDEFVVVMPNSDTAMAYACAERIRTRITQALDHAATNPITLSIGVASTTPNDTPLDLMIRADRALYAAKAHGKNEVRVEGIATEDARLRHQVSPHGAAYILIADHSDSRAETYRECAQQSRVGLLVARDRGQALRVMQQFGPPNLLVVDMDTRALNGVGLLEWLHVTGAHTSVVALSSSATLKRYLSTTDAAAYTTVLSPYVASALLRSALATAMLRFAPATRNSAAGDEPERPWSDATTPRVTDPRPRLEWQHSLLERQRGESEVARELARFKREGRPLSVVLFDISSPSASNAETSGHATTVAAICETFIRGIRPSDLPIQWSGTELLLVLPELRKSDARAVAERVRAAMGAASGHRIAISGGVAEMAHDEQFGSVVKRAGEQLMLALSHGRNRVN